MSTRAYVLECMRAQALRYPVRVCFCSHVRSVFEHLGTQERGHVSTGLKT